MHLRDFVLELNFPGEFSPKNLRNLLEITWSNTFHGKTYETSEKARARIFGEISCSILSSDISWKFLL